MTTTTAELAPLGQRFAHTLLCLDQDALAKNSTHQFSWTIPGHGLVSGLYVGVPAVIALATTIRRHGIAVEIEQIRTGHNRVTAILHETGTRAGEPFDVRVALTVVIDHSRVDAIIGYISDVAAYDNYLDGTPGAESEVASFNVAAADAPSVRQGHDATKGAAMSSRSTGLRAALLRRPRFDQVGALQATRLERSAGQQTGRPT